ncbi:MAG: alpha/beta hydrolase [Bacteroidota bacterium]|nr:alpha/beta hydrolase [Bacteroidota bacterium]
MKIRCFIISVFLLSVSVFVDTIPSLAQTQSPGDHIVKSEFNGKSYRLNVSLPKAYSISDSARYPVLYVLDGKFSYQSFKSIREVLDLAHEIKEVIIVAIESDGSNDADWFASRYGDFTPSGIPQADTQWAKMMQIPVEKMKSGGASLFLSTLEKNLIPFIDLHYKTNGSRSISGHSLGGLFAGYCLVKKPALFVNYGINSPSFWWNNNEMLLLEQTFAEQNAGMSAHVFFSAGALEGDMMIGPLTALINSLKSHGYKGLRMNQQIFEGETHVSVVAACSSRALRVLFGANLN